MLKYRVLTALPLFFLLVWAIVALPVPYLLSIFSIIMLLAAWEWTGLMRLSKRWQCGLYLLLIALLLWVLTQNALPRCVLLIVSGVGVFWWCAMLVLLSRYGQGKTAGINQVWQKAIIGLVILMPFFTSLVWLQALPQGRELIITLILIVASMDTGGYFVGRYLGKHPLAASISPKKTIEGAIGGVVLMLVLVAISESFLHLGLRQWISLVLIGIVVGLFSIVGDLTESVFKRLCGAKDSGKLLPGHGGILDRIDGFTAAAPIYVIGLLLVGIVS